MSVFPLSSSSTGMWFQVHGRLSTRSPIKIVAHCDKHAVIRGAISISSCGFWLRSKPSGAIYKQLYPVGPLVSTSDLTDRVA